MAAAKRILDAPNVLTDSGEARDKEFEVVDMGTDWLPAHGLSALGAEAEIDGDPDNILICTCPALYIDDPCQEECYLI